VSDPLQIEKLRGDHSTDAVDCGSVRGKDERAPAFCAHFGFIRSSTDPLQLFLLIKDIRRVEGV
jgi:hypothetical protein